MFGKIRRFYKEVLQEFHKIVWPNRSELVTTTIIVVVSVVLVSFIFLAFDYIVHGIIKFILNLGKNV
jgi:preprotein translocase subunit SecE